MKFVALLISTSSMNLMIIISAPLICGSTRLPAIIMPTSPALSSMRMATIPTASLQSSLLPLLANIVCLNSTRTSLMFERTTLILG